MLLRPHLFANISRISLVYHVFQRHNQMVPIVFRVCAVKLVVDRDKSERVTGSVCSICAMVLVR